MEYKILVDNEDYTNSVALPFTEQYVLDQALDNGVLNLKGIKRNSVFKPYTSIEITKDTDVYKYFVAQDVMTEIIGTETFNHDLTLIEETKYLEKKVVDTNTTTNPLEHDYFKNRHKVVPEEETTEAVIRPDTYVTPLETGTTFTFLSCREMALREAISNMGISLNGVTIFTTTDVDRSYTTTLQNGIYVVEYLGASVGAYAKFTMYSMPKNSTARLDKSITYVVNRLLAITDTLRASETPALTFNQEQASFYENVKAPEFAMTKSTLRECLDQVGAYIHSIVRLENGIIYFDGLGGNVETSAIENYSGHFETQDCEQYASQLDSVVDNLVNIDDEAQGTMTEPFVKGYKTLRADGTIRIGDGDSASVCFETTYPIEKIKSLKIDFLKVGSTIIRDIDITPYVYKYAEYQALSSIYGTFPNSKAYAIYYTQGQKNISGLTFKIPNAISPIFEHRAIENILGQTIGRNFENGFSISNLIDLTYTLEYYPSTTARVKQSKSYLGDFDKEVTSIYNQGANKVDSRYYGENLKGAIARLGNVEKTITENVTAENKLKRVGELIGDYYISKIDIENMPDQIKVTYGLSKDFNALNKYIGIMNNIRMYEVSEKQAVERYVNYEDYCVIGDGIQHDGKELLTNQAINNMLLQFNGETNTSNAVSVARLQGYDIDNLALEEVDLPVFSLGFGNSIWLGCKYEDNYSAGNQSQPATKISTISDDYFKIQNYVPYGDNWGEIETLSIKMFDYLAEINDRTTAIQMGNELPEATIEPTQTSLLDTNNDPIVIKKDSRETIHFGYQMHFVTNDEQIIIGSQLGQGSPLVTNFETSSASMYILPEKINKFAKKIDLTNATLVEDFGISANIVVQNRQIVFPNETATANGKSWVIVDNATSNLLFGKNIEIKENDTIKGVKMSFTHKMV